MQTRLHPQLRSAEWAGEAERILRSCVHCGFCTATCPTYQLLGDELDSPRGRIYLIKEMLETDSAGRRSQLHLDRCLTCRACETACPSDVAYGQLLEIGREQIEQRVGRPLTDRFMRWLLCASVPYPRRLRPLIAAARAVRGLLPASLRRPLSMAAPRRRGWPQPAPTSRGRRVVLLEGCVQQLLTPRVNAAARRLLAAAGVETVRVAEEGCCGALSLHLGRTEEAHRLMSRNVDALLPWLGRGANAIVSTASGCGVTLKDYGRSLGGDPTTAKNAGEVAARVVDLSEYLQAIGYRPSNDLGRGRRVAWQAPCTLQHGQKITDPVEGWLREAGYVPVATGERHSCCGSAGGYSILQRELSRELRDRKLAALTRAGPELIATGNVGCQWHLAAGTPLPVRHWVELLAPEG